MLWLNLNRVRTQRAWDFKIGMQLATSMSKPSEEVLDAITLDPALIPDLDEQESKKAYLSRVQQELGF